MRGEGGETRGNANDDLRAHPDFLNLVIWLDESAGEWGPAGGGESKDKWLAPGGGRRVRGPARGGVSLHDLVFTRFRVLGAGLGRTVPCTETVDASNAALRWNLAQRVVDLMKEKKREWGSRGPKQP